MTDTGTLTPAEAFARLEALTVVDVRGPGELAGGHLPGAHNIPLDRLEEALPALREAAARGPLLMVCASGARSAKACGTLAAAGVDALGLAGGTAAWQAAGYPVTWPEGETQRWAMDRQVRLAAGSLVLAGLIGGRAVPALRWVSAGVGAGLVFSAVSNTCAMAKMLSRLPYNRPRRGWDLDAELAALRG